ncbi:hypothetical protein M8R20_18620 [Pseudomonas sp. R2.Fl]|nr:hypothetical protein [Pseudomonas sp. R2.Fl]
MARGPIFIAVACIALIVTTVFLTVFLIGVGFGKAALFRECSPGADQMSSWETARQAPGNEAREGDLRDVANL